MKRCTTQSVRYIRDYVNGSTANGGDHWVEIQGWESSSTAFTDGLTWLFHDHLGSTNVSQPAVGGTAVTQLYKAWGESRWSSASLPTKYTYTGQRDDNYINFLWYNSRWYDAGLGRFNQPDIIIPLASQGVQAFNRYEYVNSNPLKYIDPSGHEICWEDGYCQSKGYNVDDHLSYYGVSLTGISSGWTESRKLDILLGVQAVGSALSDVIGMGLQGAANAFRSVFGMINMEWCNNCVNGYGWAYNDHTIRFDGMYQNPIQAMRLVVHELGHIFDRAVCAANDPSGSCSNIFGSGTARKDLSSRTMLCTDSQYCLGRKTTKGPGDGEYWGYAGGWGDWQFGANDGVAEVWADMFLGWVFNTWEKESTRATNRSDYMNGAIPAYMNLILSP